MEWKFWGSVSYVMFFPNDFASFYSGFRKNVEHSDFFCTPRLFPQRTFDAQTLDSFYIGLSPDVFGHFFLIGLLGVKPTGKPTEVHKKSRGLRTMNEVKTGCQRG